MQNRIERRVLAQYFHQHGRSAAQPSVMVNGNVVTLYTCDGIIGTYEVVDIGTTPAGIQVFQVNEIVAVS